MERRNKRMKVLAEITPMNLADINPEEEGLTVIEPNLNVGKEDTETVAKRVLTQGDVENASPEELQIWEKYYGSNELQFENDDVELLFLQKTSPVNPWAADKIRASRKKRMEALAKVTKKADFYDSDLYAEEEAEYRHNPTDALEALKAMVKDKVFFEDLDPAEQAMIKSSIRDLMEDPSIEGYGGKIPGTDAKWPEIVDKYPQYLPIKQDEMIVKELDPWADTKIRARRKSRMDRVSKIK